MSSSSEYLAEQYQALADNYKVDCLKIARELAKRLLSEGKQPHIAMLVRFEQWKQGAYYGPIMPVRYNGRVTFTKHYVCCCDGLVYDPLLKDPAPLDQYSMLAFEIQIPMEIFIDYDGIQNYLDKPISYART